jgi:hypothetical protein
MKRNNRIATILILSALTILSLCIFSFAAPPGPPDIANRVPTIAGNPTTGINAKTTYTFTPYASDQDNDTLTFSCLNKPSWATINSSNGALTGTPQTAGTFNNIVISVSDGKGGYASLPAFSITVVASGGGGGGGGTPVPVMAGWWLFAGMLAGIGFFARRRKE